MSKQQAVPGQDHPSAAQRLSYDIATFCEITGTSRMALYRSWHEGIGPRRFRVGKRVFISHEAAGEWIKQREAVTGKKD